MSDLYVPAGSFEPKRWTARHPVTGVPLDLTLTGYLVSGVVRSTNDKSGVKLLDLVDDEVWARTADGGIVWQPPSAVSAEWPSVAAFYQAWLWHPEGNRTRFDSGRFVIDTDFDSSED